MFWSLSLDTSEEQNWGPVDLAVPILNRRAGSLSDAVIVPKVVTEEMQITFPYDETSRVMNILSHRKAKIVDTIYDDDVTLRLLIRKNSASLLADELVNITRGNIAVKRGGA